MGTMKLIVFATLLAMAIAAPESLPEPNAKVDADPAYVYYLTHGYYPAYYYTHPTSTVISSENVVPSLNPHPLPHLSPKPIPLISMVIMAILTTEVTTDTPIGTLARGVLMPNP